MMEYAPYFHFVGTVFDGLQLLLVPGDKGCDSIL